MCSYCAMKTDLQYCSLRCTLQVYMRPDLELLLELAGRRLSISAGVLTCSAADGLMSEITQGWELHPGQLWEHAMLLLVPVSHDVCPGPGWYDVVDVVAES